MKLRMAADYLEKKDMAAAVTMGLDEFQSLQDARMKAELEVAKLKQQITEQKITASDPILIVVARAALEVTRFAIANLPPESTVHWPTDALRSIGDNLPSMPDASHDDQEFAITMITFAEECDRFERRGKALGTR
jgi:hypothetical protein